MTGLGIILAILCAAVYPESRNNHWSEEAQSFYWLLGNACAVAAIACGILGALP